jgi:type IX secretion system PorP/SprF family membrane protein
MEPLHLSVKTIKMKITLRSLLLLFFTCFILSNNNGQENYYSHYFSSSSQINPAFAGDTRYADFHLDTRLIKNTSSKLIRNTLLSYGQKIPNYRAGFSINFNQNSKEYRETQIKANYSYTIPINKRYWLKSGLGLSWNFLNSNAYSYLYPDQFDLDGYTGQPTGEPALNERANYPAFAAGFIVYNENSWISVSSDYMNRPKQKFAGQIDRVPIFWSVEGSYLFPIDKNKKTKRIFLKGGGLDPYSSIGPVFSFTKQGPFYRSTIGINAFLRPVFWGIEYQNNSFAGNIFNSGISTVAFLVGYRNESLSLAYSYDFRIDQNTVNYRGAHEISLVYYLFSTKKDYVKMKLVPLPNQLMY